MTLRTLIVTLVLASTVLAGCAQNDGGTGGTTTTTTMTTTTPAGGTTTTTPASGGLGTSFVVGTEAEFAPFESIDESGNFVGYDIDVMEEIARRNNWTITWRNVGFDVLIPQVQQGQIDMAISAMTIREDRAEIVDFSLPYFVAENQAVTKRADDNRTFSAVADLDGLRVGVQRGTTAQFYMEEENVEVVAFDAYPAAIQALAIGEVDVVVMDAPAQERAVSEDDRIVIAFTFPVQEEYGIAVQKGNTQLLNAINDALEAMTDDGTLAQLRTKWGV